MAPVTMPGLLVARQGIENMVMFELDGQQVIIRSTAGEAGDDRPQGSRPGAVRAADR